MATTLNTRISLKYDSYENWTSNNPTLLKGEAAIVVIPGETSAVANEPIVLLKIGDGTSAFNDLSFVGGIAADVYDWAKKSTKPEYNADEIKGLEAYISGKVEDTNTKYQLVKDADDPHKIKLQSREKDSEDWTDVVTIETADTVYDDSELKALIGQTSVAEQINAAINAIKDGTSIHSFKDVEDALQTKQGVGNYATKEEAKGYADAKDAAIAAAQKAGTDAQSAVETLEATVDNKADKANSLSGYGIEDAYTKRDADAAIASAVASAGHLKREIVTELPGTDVADKDTIYMIKDNAVESGDAYKEYMLIEGAFAQIGDTSVDLTQYAKSSEVGEQIQSAKTEAASDATAKANGAERNAKTYADELNESLSEQMSTIDSKIDTKADSADLDDISSQLAGKANILDLDDIATSGDVNDLKQTSGYIILNCGSAMVNVDDE